MAENIPNLNARFRRIRLNAYPDFSHYPKMILSSAEVTRIIANSNPSDSFEPSSLSNPVIITGNPNFNILRYGYFPIQINVLGAGGIGKSSLIRKFRSEFPQLRITTDDIAKSFKRKFEIIYSYKFLHTLYTSSVFYPSIVTNPAKRACVNLSEHGYFGNLLITGAHLSCLSSKERRDIKDKLKWLLPMTTGLINFPINIINIIARPDVIRKRNGNVPKLFQNEQFAGNYYKQSLAYHYLAQKRHLPCLSYVDINGEQDFDDLYNDFRDAVTKIYLLTLAIPSNSASLSSP